jgi:hypothetical protein
MFNDFAAHSNAIFFPPVVVASLLFWLCGLPSVIFECPWVASGCFWFCLVCWLWLPSLFLPGQEVCCVLVGHHSRSLARSVQCNRMLSIT